MNLLNIHIWIKPKQSQESLNFFLIHSNTGLQWGKRALRLRLQTILYAVNNKHAGNENRKWSFKRSSELEMFDNTVTKFRHNLHLHSPHYQTVHGFWKLPEMGFQLGNDNKWMWHKFISWYHLFNYLYDIV